MAASEDPAAPKAEEGLQRERTALAWDRTGLSFMLVAALLVRVVGPPYGHLRHLPAALTLLFGGMLVVGAGRGLAWTGERAPRAHPILLRAVGAFCLGLSAACLVAILTS